MKPTSVFRCAAIMACLGTAFVHAQDMQHQPQGNQIPGPGESVGANLGWFNDMMPYKADPNADHDAWLHDLKAWRALFTDYRRPLGTFETSFRAATGLYFFKASFE